MEKSASEPVLPQEAYKLPCHGVGDTGHENRQLMGPFYKDDGKNSSRINLIQKRAREVPAPDAYLAHAEWTGNRGSGFGKLNRVSLATISSGPDCRHYESKEIGLGVSNASKQVLSTNPRTTMGHIAKGPKRSFTDQAVRHGKKVPDPGIYKVDAAYKFTESNTSRMTSWKLETSKHVSRGKPEPRTEFHYTPSHKHVEETKLTYTVPKVQDSSFLDKAVREKLVDIGNPKTNRQKKEVPGPGTYPVHSMKDWRVSRGTKQVQLRGMNRSAMSGFF